jgi:hypothetical protein
MKKVIMMAAVLMMAGCGFMKNSTTNNTTATATAPAAATTTTANTASNAALVAGQGAGSALQALYSQYKVDGKYDYKNLQNIMNTMTLVSNCEGLKDNFKDKTYLAEFGKGLIASSLGLVTQNNVQTVTNSLVDMVKNSETLKNAQNQTTQAVQTAATQAQSTASQAATYANTAAQYAGALSSLLGAFSGK